MAGPPGELRLESYDDVHRLWAAQAQGNENAFWSWKASQVYRRPIHLIPFPPPRRVTVSARGHGRERRPARRAARHVAQATSSSDPPDPPRPVRPWPNEAEVVV
jgi:hypothetical protein